MNLKVPDEKKIFPLLVLVAIILLSNPIVINLNKGPDSLLSEEAYYHLRMIDQYRDSGIYTYDTLQKTPLDFDAFYFLVAKSNLSNRYITNIFPVILGIIAFILFYFILKKDIFENNTLIFTLIVLISSPLYIYSFSTLNPDAFYIVILLTSILLYLKKNYLALISSGLLAILNIPYFVVLIMLFLIYELNNKNLNSYMFNVTLFFSLIAASVYYLIGLPNIFGQVISYTSVSGLFATLGGVKGFSIIAIVLTLVGMFVFWKRSFFVLIIYFLFVLSFIGSIYYLPLRLFIVFLSALFAGKALSNLVVRKWNVSMLKNITLLLIVCSMIFSTIVFMKTEINFISSKQIEGIKFLSVTDENKTIFNIEEKGYLIQQISNRKTYLDSKSFARTDYKERINKSDVLFYSRNLKEIEAVLQSANINHIYIDKDMFNGRVWNGPSEGALFIYENSKKFVKVFDNAEVKIYRYLESN